MSEPTAPTTAEKRKWLSENGYAVGTRGKLSQAHEDAFDTKTPAAESSGSTGAVEGAETQV